MQRRNDLCALADRRSNAFDGFRSDISNGEDATPVGFQWMAIAPGIFAGQHKPLASSATSEPASQFVFGSRADE